MTANNEAVPEPLALRPYSGKFMVRVPPELHRQLAIEAAESASASTDWPAPNWGNKKRRTALNGAPFLNKEEVLIFVIRSLLTAYCSLPTAHCLLLFRLGPSMMPMPTKTRPAKTTQTITQVAQDGVRLCLGDDPGR